MYALLVRPLSVGELDAYCDEAAAMAIDLGARVHEVPRTWESNAAYMARAYSSGAIVVGSQARGLATLALSATIVVGSIAFSNANVSV